MQLKGILPALVTPFDSRGAVNHGVLASIIEFQLKAGVKGFVPLAAQARHS
ncbi:MAG: dihydrodipicolinate synthase family protein [Trinickia sp.]|jgi:4-hydroxy-tetrahydrodipicolinate synthase